MPAGTTLRGGDPDVPGSGVLRRIGHRSIHQPVAQTALDVAAALCSGFTSRLSMRGKHNIPYANTRASSWADLRFCKVGCRRTSAPPTPRSTPSLFLPQGQLNWHGVRGFSCRIRDPGSLLACSLAKKPCMHMHPHP